MSKLPSLPLLDMDPRSYLFLLLSYNNHVNASKCNYKGVGWRCVGGGMIAMHATTKRNTLKSYYQKKRTVWQIYGGGQLPPYVCGDGDSESGCNYQSSSEECCQNAKAGLCWGVAMETGPLPDDYVFTKTLKIYTRIFIAHLQNHANVSFCFWGEIFCQAVIFRIILNYGEAVVLLQFPGLKEQVCCQNRGLSYQQLNAIT